MLDRTISGGATIDAEATGDLPPGFLRDIVERVMPSVLTSHREGDAEPDDVMRRHVRETCQLLAERSTVIADGVRNGTLAIVGAEYALAEGRARVVTEVGTAGATA